MSADQNPRQHHYDFAHKALPNTVFKGASRMLELLSSPMGGPFLLSIWEEVGKHVGKEGRIPPDDLRCASRDTGKQKVITVHMPRPQRQGEAWFVGFVVTPESRRMLVFKTPATVRCFSLLHGEGGTTLCEWDAQGTQLSAAPGPQPSADAFLQAIMSA